MSKESSSSSRTGVSTLGILGLIFVVLKLLGITEVATWSWWWVTAPFWIGFAVVLAIFLVIFIGTVIAVVFEK